MRWLGAVGIVGVVVMLPAVGDGADWPRYHFDNQNTGYSPTETLQFPMYLKWTYQVQSPAVATSPPIVVGSKVYFCSQTGSPNPAGNQVLAVDRNTAALIWSFTAGDVLSMPTYGSDGLIYVTSEDQHLYCLDPGTGALMWSFVLAGGNGYGAPLFEAGSVYTVSKPKEVYRIDASSHTLVWSYETVLWPATWPWLSTDGSSLFVDGSEDVTYALNLTNGAVNWSYTRGAMTQGGGNNPVSGGLVYLRPGNTPSPMAIAVTASGGAFAWSYSCDDTVAYSIRPNFFSSRAIRARSRWRRTPFREPFSGATLPQEDSLTTPSLATPW